MTSSVNHKPTDHYLGDGVYLQESDWEAGGWWVYTHNGYEVQDAVYLETSVIEALKRYIK